jgi:hypothetical protein
MLDAKHPGMGVEMRNLELRSLAALFAAVACAGTHAQTAPGHPGGRAYHGGLVLMPNADGSKVGYYINGKLIQIAVSPPAAASGIATPPPHYPPAPSPCGDIPCAPKPSPPPVPPACSPPCITFDRRVDGHFLFPDKPVAELPNDITSLLSRARPPKQ